ncbi:MAG: metallophosphoesterase [Verrucomicrobiales bacterium]|nr:metallophosphoesterase [Verrucomicrobiales bacterium]
MKHSRRKFIVTAGSTLSSAALASSKTKEAPVFSFGLMADCQYVDAETRGTRFYRESPRKLAEAIGELNQKDLAFTFHVGDFIDREFESFAKLDPIAATLRSTLYHALGNHDYEVADEDKEKVPGRLGLERNYYSVQKDGFRFVVLDTTDVSVYRHPGGTAQQKAAKEELAKWKAAGSRSASSWNSRPGEEQIAWIENELKTATEKEETVLVLGHHPVLPDASHSIWNAGAIHELFAKHSCAKLYLNGHNHAGAYTDEQGVHYLTLDGMVETESTNAFAYADLFPDRLEITGFGRQESHTLKFR